MEKQINDSISKEEEDGATVDIDVDTKGEIFKRMLIEKLWELNFFNNKDFKRTMT